MNFKKIKDESKQALIGCRFKLFLAMLVASLIGNLGSAIGLGLAFIPLLLVGLYYITRKVLKEKKTDFNLFSDYLKNVEHDFKIIALYLFMGLIVGAGLLFFIVPGIIFGLMFGISLNLMADDPELDVLDALRKSRDLMNGHKKEYFLFILSFIGHFLLTFITLGLYGIYFLPYFQAANVNYYLHLTKQNFVKEESEPEPPVIEAEPV